MRLLFFAEGEGFKPPIPERGIPDFESSAIDHSANLPKRKCKNALLYTLTFILLVVDRGIEPLCQD